MLRLTIDVTSVLCAFYQPGQPLIFELRPNPGAWPGDHRVGHPSWHGPRLEASFP